MYLHDFISFLGNSQSTGVSVNKSSCVNSIHTFCLENALPLLSFGVDAFCLASVVFSNAYQLTLLDATIFAV